MRIAILYVICVAACGGGAGPSTSNDGGIVPTGTYTDDGGTQSRTDDLGTTSTSDGGGASTLDGGNIAASGDGGTSSAGTVGITGLHTSGGHIVNGAGTIVSLHGTNHSYTEDSCWYEGGKFADGHLTQTDLDVMKTWHLNAVRVPLNEDCLLGINGVGFGGTEYVNALSDYVKLITSNGFVVIVDLHWNAPGTQISGGIGQLNMADADHAPAFWTKLATMFKSTGATDTSENSQVIFDLFNEPYLTDWSCWFKGVDAKGNQCPIVDQNKKTYAGDMAGMAQLLKAVRATGAENVVMIGGLAYSSDESSWLTYIDQLPKLPAPDDGLTTDNLAVSCHLYDFNYAGGKPVNTQTGTQIGTATGLTATLAAGFPFVIGETGNQMYNSASWFTGSTGLLTWADSEKQGYTVWSWNTDTSPTLLKSFPTSATQAVSAFTTTMGQTYYDYVSKL